MSIIKATKLQVLRFIQKNEVIEPMDLVNEFGFTPRYARIRIERLEAENPPMVEKLGVRRNAYCLTNAATRRIEYYDTRA